MNTVLMQWRLAYAGDDSLTFLEVPEGRDTFGFCNEYIRGVLDECGIEFDAITHSDVDPYYYIIQVLEMPEGFDANKVVWL